MYAASGNSKFNMYATIATRLDHIGRSLRLRDRTPLSTVHVRFHFMPSPQTRILAHSKIAYNGISLPRNYSLYPATSHEMHMKLARSSAVEAQYILSRR